MTWNLRGRIILAFAWKWLSHNLSFFWQVRSHYSFSTDSHYTFGWGTTVFIARFLSVLFTDLWRLVKPRALVTVRENFLFFIPKFATFLLFGSRFCFSFNPRTFLFRKAFHVHETISIATRTIALECKQKMLISWNRISRIKPLPRKTCTGVHHAFWGLWHLDGLLTLFRKSLFLNNSRAIWDFIFIFSKYVSFNNDLSFGPKKFFGGKIIPGRFAVTLIQSNCHYFVRKFMVYVFIGCFMWIWTAFAFPSHTAF